MITKIKSIDKNLLVEIEDGKTFKIAGSEFHVFLIEIACDDRCLVNLELNKNGEISSILFPEILRPIKIHTVINEEQNVEFHLSNVRHFLRTTNPNYNILLEKLTKSLKEQEVVLVTEYPTSHEIIEIDW